MAGSFLTKTNHMTRYRLTERTLIGNDLVEPGEIDFDGLPTSIFIPLDAEGEARRAEYEAGEVERQAQNMIAAGEVALAQLDPALVAAIRQIVVETLTERETTRVLSKQAKAKIAQS